ncbi:hypothetical protein [Novosphingobium pentaromativorans]|uniref:hypothetical protein n=1 Tax=Novosphingobium pentaromativorans TaxID=205844 RepID=UPI000ADC9F76|nr:hypothetical protein [Novosphingobium pentaromativorans]
MKGMWYFVFIIFAALSPTGTAIAQQTTIGIMNQLASGRVVSITPQSTLIMGGITDVLAQRCGPKIGVTDSDRVVLADFLNVAQLRMQGGGRYSDPSIAGQVNNQIQGGLLYLRAGQMAHSRYGCSRKSEDILHYIAESVRSSRSKSVSKPFMRTCSVNHSSAQCRCLLSLGKSVRPGVENIPYSANLMRSIIKSNPLIGLSVISKCGLTRY